MTLYDPEPGPNSYGTPDGVGALARAWTDEAHWTDPDLYYDDRPGTNPSLSTVVDWIDETSAVLNAALAKYGFVIPITQADARLSAISLIQELVADRCNYANATGRFFTQRFIESGYSVWRTIRNDIDAWVQEYAPGLEALGAVRVASPVDQIGYRGVDEAGEETFPIFQRKAFGNRPTNWTKG